jgi:aspartyl-tRNA(Asn)/glutamyl-tRNA(Gln) amidotransferase subunit B
MPGALPALNRKAVEYTVAAGLALHCNISRFSTFERKNYFYPDLPKAYQISQLEYPLCVGGYLDIKTEAGDKRINLNRIHLEEDAGKLVHAASGGTYVDYNRGSIPLIEIVTEPDLRSADEALTFLESLKSVIKYTGISDCRMEQGTLRCDVNVSLCRPGEPYGTRTEMKNLASFKAAHRAVMYEAKRQREILSDGGQITQETRRWDDVKGKSFTMRTKEDAQDYRYFPDPDILPIKLSGEYIESIRQGLPMLPGVRARLYIDKYKLPKYDAEVLTADKEVADFFDACVRLYDNPKIISNWVMTDIMRKLKENKEAEDIFIPLSPDAFTQMLKLLAAEEINQNAAKTIFEAYWKGDGRSPAQLIEELGLAQISDSSALEDILKGIVAANPNAVKDYRAGNTKAIAYFVGQAMKATKGAASPAVVNGLIKKLLE